MAKLNLDAKEALAEINRLITELEALKSATKSMAATTAANFQAMEATISRLKQKVAALGNQMNYLKAILQQNSSALTQNTKELDKNTKKTQQDTKSKKDNAKATKEASNSTKSFSISLSSILKGAGLLQIGRQLLALTQNIYSTIKTFDSLSFTLEKITKNAFDFENSQRFLLRITKAYGVELITTTTRWSRFLAAAKESGLALRDTEEIFESMTKASAVLGLNTDELTSVYLALEQMLSKGKITTEELRRQLGERLPGAMGIMASSIGVTIPELDKMLKRGEVLSAEVLPDFARAVERAYGIENADRIETLIAKQNRLTAAWQTFIKNISEGDSVIKKVFGGLLDFINDIIERWDIMLQSEEQEMRVRIGFDEEEFKNKLEASSRRVVDLTSPVAEQEAQLKAREARLLEALKTAQGEERNVILNNIDEIARIRAEKEKEVVKIMKERAKENIEIAYSEYLQTKKIYDEIYADFKAAEKGNANPVFNQDQLDQARANFSYATAEYNVWRKLVEESNVQVIPETEVQKTQRNLRRIKDYWLETMNEILSGVKSAQDEIAGDDTLDLSVRLDAIKKSAEIQTQILRNEYQIQIRDAEDKLKSEIESIESSVQSGTIAREKANAQIKALEKEKNDFILFENTKLSNEIIELNNKTIKSLGETTDEVTESSLLSSTQDIYNKRISAAKKAFQESKKTAADQIALEREIEQASIDAANAIIDVKIDLLRKEIAILEASGTASGEYIAELKRQINSLESQRNVAPINVADWNAVFEEALEIGRDFVNSVGGIFDAVFERRIENINAEIEAEKEKYDKLIALAEGNEEQQATLERNKEDRIKKLEKERLKEEQKQAKARKKFAIAEIAISTARAIMGIWADFPKFDFGVTAGIMTGVIGALGAAQMAAVLAQPIPQYKHGVDNLSKDQIAMINDGSFKEYIERNGRILSTDKKNAIVALKKGDTVYKNYDDMAARSNVFNVKNMASIQTKSDNRFLEDVTSSVLKGISKAKINNKVNVNSIIKDNRYKDSLSRWN